MATNGGSAFPSELQFDSRGGCANSSAELRGGMSLRDYFAAKAPEMPNHWERFARSADDPSAAWIAREARWRYAYADAMLAEREGSR